MKSILCVALLCCASAVQAQVYSFTGFDTLRKENLTGQINIDDRSLFINIPGENFEAEEPYHIRSFGFRFDAKNMAYAPGGGGDFVDPPADLLVGGNKNGYSLVQLYGDKAFIFAMDNSWTGPGLNSFQFPLTLTDITLPPAAAVPEPSGILLVLLGLLGVYCRR